MSAATPTVRAATDVGAIYLVPCPLDFGTAQPVPLSDVLPEHTQRQAAALQHWICENAKSTRAFLKRVGEQYPLCVPVQEMHIQVLPHAAHKHGDHRSDAPDMRPLLAPALAGHAMGLVSEAGMPAIADPGSSVVRAAHQLGLPVIPLVGPVSLLLALAASGLNGQNFAFVGYVPQETSERQRRLRELEKLSLASGQTQIFIETPYRNQALLESLLQVLQPSTRLSVSSALTLPQATTLCMTVQQWRAQARVLDKHMPAVFALAG